MIYKYLTKQLFDYLFSFLALIIALPLIVCLVVMLFYVNKGSPFFYQYRPGKNGRLFKVIKFKTMNDNRMPGGELLPDYQRITKVGRCLRSYSIDELPQLFNILNGKMSLVGPRPLLKEYLPLYSEEQSRRHEVKPGITGFAQINGRNAISWKEKFQMDVWYVDNITFLLDLKIILKSIIKVMNRHGINASEQFTMNPFNGNN